jgi:protein involved in polysaccharide export with SLBB domain
MCLVSWTLCLLVVTLSVGCAGSRSTAQRPPPVPAEMAAAPAPDTQTYRIQPGDQLDLKFFYNPELNESVVVRPDGKISLQLVDEVVASGLTPSELDAALTKLYGTELRRPEVSVILRSLGAYRVYVGGEVNNPALVGLADGMGPLQAVMVAGGFKETAKPEAALVIRRGADNRPVPIPVDLREMIRGAGAGDGLRLQPGDVVYIPKTWIAEANKFVNQYIERLLLFRGTTLGFGFTYELNPDNGR